jgi:VWFA-related protein
MIEFPRLGFFAALLVLSASATRSPAQTPPQDQAAPAPTSTSESQTSPVVIRKESRLVLVDAVVTDKKGNYVKDLTEKDFKLYEDNKEQPVASFSAGADISVQAKGQKRYLILFFDNSSMAAPDQIQARGAAVKFVQANAGPDRMMAVVDFGGKLRIVQNFTANSDALTAAVSGVKYSSVSSNPDASNSSSLAPLTVASAGLSSLNNAEADFGARTMLLAVRSLAKNLRAVPGRKMLVLFSAGFALTAENESELTATIDACNKPNVAIYSLDVRGLVSAAPVGGSARNATPGRLRDVAHHPPSRSNAPARLLLTAYSLGEPQHPGGGAGAGGGAGGGRGGAGGAGGGAGGGRGGAGGGTGGTGGAGGGRGGTGGTGGTSGTGGAGGKGGTGGTNGGGTNGGGTRGGNGGYTNNPYTNGLNNPYNQSRTIVPQFPPSATTNQQILAALAEGTGGFSIFNTNDLLGGLEKIGREQSEFYILGYVPPETPEGSCHTLKVKLNRGGLNVRSRSGYCNARTANPLDGKPLEKQLELHAAGASTGSIHGAMQTPYFYTAPNVARVNLSMEIPPDSLNFNKEKGRYHANVNILGIAYRDDGSVGAKFNDTVNLDLEKDEWKEFTKNPYHYQNQFDAASGAYKLTVVLSGGGDTFGKFESPLQIDPYDGQHFSLGSVALTNSATRISDIPSGALDSVLLEDHSPLVVKGMQVLPSANNRFKRTDNVILYTEIYEPGLTSVTPPRVGFAYHIYERASNKDVFFSGLAPADSFIQKGNPVIPSGLTVNVKALSPGSYRLVVQAVDSEKHQAPNRIVDFDITE